jgi:hypothetical protein
MTTGQIIMTTHSHTATNQKQEKQRHEEETNAPHPKK